MKALCWLWVAAVLSGLAFTSTAMAAHPVEPGGGCLAASGLESGERPYTAAGAPPDASPRAAFLHAGQRPESTTDGSHAAIIAAAAACGGDEAARVRALDTLIAIQASTRSGDRPLLNLQLLELRFGLAVTGEAADADGVAAEAGRLAGDVGPAPIRAALTGLAAQARALAALKRQDDAGFAEAMNAADSAGADLVNAAPPEAFAIAAEGGVRGRYLHYSHAARLMRLWTLHAQGGRLLADSAVIETLADDAGWTFAQMQAAHSAHDEKERARLARDAAMARFGAARLHLDQSLGFEHSPYLWAAGRLQIVARLELESDREDLAPARRRTLARWAAAQSALAERALLRP